MATKYDVSAFNMAANMRDLYKPSAIRIFEMVPTSDKKIEFIKIESINNCYHYFHSRALNNFRGEDMLKANTFKVLAKKHGLDIEND